MVKYAFFNEYDGKKPSENAYARPVDTIVANNISNAADQFARKNRLKKISFDILTEGSFRVFYNRKTWLSRSEEYIYFVQNIGD